MQNRTHPWYRKTSRWNPTRANAANQSYQPRHPSTLSPKLNLLDGEKAALTFMIHPSPVRFSDDHRKTNFRSAAIRNDTELDNTLTSGSLHHLILLILKVGSDVDQR